MLKMSNFAKVLIPVAGLALVLGTACGGGGGTTGAAKPTAAPAAKSDAKPAGGQVAAGDVTRGKTLFTQSCASCHGADAKGLPGLGKDMTTSEFIKSQSDAQLLAFIKQGRPASDPANTTKVDMPPKGGNPALTDAQIMDIIAYLRTLQQ